MSDQSQSPESEVAERLMAEDGRLLRILIETELRKALLKAIEKPRISGGERAGRLDKEKPRRGEALLTGIATWGPNHVARKIFGKIV